MTWYARLWQALAEAWAMRGLGPDAVAVVMALPAGYKTPQPPSVPESRDLKDCEPRLQSQMMLLLDAFKKETGMELFVTCTWRSKARQKTLYAQGRTTPGCVVTWIDGETRRSRHNYYPSQAVDVCVDSDPGPGKHAVWDVKLYKPLGELCRRFGLEWGGSWSSLKDYPHIQMPGETT